MALNAKPSSVCPTCMVKSPSGGEVVVNKSDRQSYEKRGYKYLHDLPFAGSPANIADIKRADGEKAEQATKVAEIQAEQAAKVAEIQAEQAAKAEADNSASGGDSEASGSADADDIPDDDFDLDDGDN